MAVDDRAEGIPLNRSASKMRRLAHWQTFSLVLLTGFALMAGAADEGAKVIKVLPHFLDAKGRHTQHPSLYERDAYQAELRANPSLRNGLKFDVQWKADTRSDLTLRVETRSIYNREPLARMFEKPVKAGRGSRWTAVPITGEEYQRLGELLAWRVTLWRDGKPIAEQKSFLW